MVLAEANKQSELRARGINPPASDNGVANGAIKKDEEPPAVEDPPPTLVAFFERMCEQEYFIRLQPGTLCRHARPFPRTPLLSLASLRAFTCRNSYTGSELNVIFGTFLSTDTVLGCHSFHDRNAPIQEHFASQNA